MSVLSLRILRSYNEDEDGGVREERAAGAAGEKSLCEFISKFESEREKNVGTEYLERNQCAYHALSVFCVIGRWMVVVLRLLSFRRGKLFPTGMKMV